VDGILYMKPRLLHRIRYDMLLRQALSRVVGTEETVNLEMSGLCSTSRDTSIEFNVESDLYYHRDFKDDGFNDGGAVRSSYGYAYVLV